MSQDPSSRPPTPMLDKIPGRMGARFLSSARLSHVGRVSVTWPPLLSLII